jgi:inner membrane protein
MFIGHLPEGYVLTRALWSALQKVGGSTPKWRPFILAGLVSSILPDIDLLYFYLIDNRQHLHHSYWTHLPVYWLITGILMLLFIVVSKRKQWLPYVIVVGANIFLHLCLDTIVGKMRWLYPISNKDFYFFNVPRIHSWYVWDFVLHWTFLLEFVPIIAAIYVYVQWPSPVEAHESQFPCHDETSAAEEAKFGGSLSTLTHPSISVNADNQ